MDIGVTERLGWETQRIQVKCVITGSAPRLRYGNGKQTWRPESAVVSWERRRSPDSPEWAPWRCVQMIVKGPWLKADGSVSSRTEHREDIILIGGTVLTDSLLAATRPVELDHMPPNVSAPPAWVMG